MRIRYPPRIDGDCGQDWTVLPIVIQGTVTMQTTTLVIALAIGLGTSAYGQETAKVNPSVRSTESPNVPSYSALHARELDSNAPRTKTPNPLFAPLFPV